jgi:hypothetical protein
MHRPSPSKHASIKGIPWLSSGVTRLLLANLLVAACIYAAGVLTALLLKGKNPSLTLIWPAGGIALAAVILRGPWVAPGIFMPLWISCLVGGEGHLFAILAPLGTTLAIVAGAILLQRTGWNRKLSTSRDVLLLLGLAGLLPMMLAGFWTSLLLLKGDAWWSISPRGLALWMCQCSWDHRRCSGHAPGSGGALPLA